MRTLAKVAAQPYLPCGISEEFNDPPHFNSKSIRMH